MRSGSIKVRLVALDNEIAARRASGAASTLTPQRHLLFHLGLAAPHHCHCRRWYALCITLRPRHGQTEPSRAQQSPRTPYFPNLIDVCCAMLRLCPPTPLTRFLLSLVLKLPPIPFFSHIYVFQTTNYEKLPVRH